MKVTQDINLFKEAFNACGEMIILVSGVLRFFIPVRHIKSTLVGELLGRTRRLAYQNKKFR